MSKFRDKHPLRYMVQQTRARAKELGIEHNIEAEDLHLPQYCPALGIRLCFGEGKRSDASPSIDRLDPTKGYVFGNCVVISDKANRIKSNASSEDVMSVAIWMKGMDL